MAGLNLNMLTENASRLQMRLQETLSEHTKDFALGRASSANYFDTGEDKVKNIGRQLDSNSDREKLDAMKRLIAMISKGRNVSEFFAQVVKNVAVPNLEVRKLVYIYLSRYADAEPDLALLSINTFQRDLADSSPLIRAMALRVLSGIRVPSIGSLVVLAIKKCSADVSPYVRKASALAIPKCYSLDNSHLPSLLPILSTLLRDRSPLSIGSTAVAFEAICPTRLDLIHPHYRRLCRLLVDVDEWGQADLLELLTRYARTMLPRPGVVDGREEVDKDLQLLLTGAEPLFQSRNPAVVLAVCRAFYYLALPSQHVKIVRPILRLLDVSPQVERVVLAYILAISHTNPALFAPYYAHFLVRADDNKQVKADKIKLLRLFINVENHQALLRDFIDYADDVDDELVAGSIHGIGQIARMMPESTQQCLTALMTFIKSRHDVVVANAILVLKSLVQTQLQASPFSSSSSTPDAIIQRLAYKFEEIRHPQARACLLWLVGQYAAASAGEATVVEGVKDWAPDVLRKVAKTFRDETPLVKIQATTLAAKLLVLCPTHPTLVLLSQYLFTLARYDRNYDVRDRARMLSGLLAGVVPSLRSPTTATSAVAPSGWDKGEDVDMEVNGNGGDVGGVVLRREQVRVILFEGKMGVVEKDDHIDDDRTLVGTLTLVTGREMRGERMLPDWIEQGVESSLRNSPEEVVVVQPAAPTAIGNYAPVNAANSRGMAGFGGSSVGSGARGGGPVILTPAGSSPTMSGDGGGDGKKKGAWQDLDSFYAENEKEEEESESEESEEEDEGESEEEDGEDGSEHPEDKEEDGPESSEEEEGEDEEDEDEEQGRRETPMQHS